MATVPDKWLRDRWYEFANDPANAKNSEVSFGQFTEFYGSLSAGQKERANAVLSEWVNSDEVGLREAALSVAIEFQVVELLPAVRKRLRFLDSQLESAKLTSSRELAAIIEGDRWLEARIVEELENPEIGAERQRLRNAFQAFWTAPDPPEGIRHTDLAGARDRLDDFGRLISQASCLLSGREFDRSKLKSDPELRATLERLQDDDDFEVRRIAGEYLHNLDLIDEVLEAARVIRHP